MLKASEFFDLLIGPLREAAKKNGYALAVHGSLARDIDLIAVPWTDEAVAPLDLAEALRLVAATTSPIGVAFIKPDENDQFHRDGCPGMKPHGRLSWCFHLGGGPYIDIAVMQRSQDYRDLQDGFVSQKAELAAITKERDALRTALQRLVDAKNEKDANGDTPEYRRLKAGAWERVRETLAKIESVSSGER